jgi:hypothetical protein
MGRWRRIRQRMLMRRTYAVAAVTKGQTSRLGGKAKQCCANAAKVRFDAMQTSAVLPCPASSRCATGELLSYGDVAGGNDERPARRA